MVDKNRKVMEMMVFVAVVLMMEIMKIDNNGDNGFVDNSVWSN